MWTDNVLIISTLTETIKAVSMEKRQKFSEAKPQTNSPLPKSSTKRSPPDAPGSL